MPETRVQLAELVRALASVVGEARVSTRANDRSAYSRDMWPRLLLAVRAGAPAEHPPDVERGWEVVVLSVGSDVADGGGRAERH